jgi:hypothetical protein
MTPGLTRKSRRHRRFPAGPALIAPALIALTCPLAAGSCSKSRKPSEVRCPRPEAVTVQCDPESRKKTEQFLRHNHGAYRAALSRATAYLDGLKVDPVALLKEGIKGKKKLAEILDVYFTLFRAARPAEKEKYRTRFKKAARHAYRTEYHDMGQLDDRSFKQNSTSYLRVAYLMDRMKLDTRQYRKHIRSILDRLNAQMGRRGPHQQMAFHWYYKHFGLKEPFALDQAFTTGYIAKRADPYKLRLMETYHLTHEVFVVYRYGEKLDAAYFSKADMAYLRRTLDILTTYYIRRRNADVTAELLSCIRFVNLTGLPVYRDGIRFLFKSQNTNGSWGKYRRLRRRYGDSVEIRAVLHTTLVAVEALVAAFRKRPRPKSAPAAKPAPRVSARSAKTTSR